MAEKTNVNESELVSVSSGKIDGKTVLILSIRISPEKSLQATNIAISGKQARRLLGDLNYLFSVSEILKKVPELDVNEEMLPDVEETEKPKKPRKKK